MELLVVAGGITAYLLYEYMNAKDEKPKDDPPQDPKKDPPPPPKPLPNIPGTTACKMPGLFWTPDFFGRGPSKYSNFKVDVYDKNQVPHTVDGVDYYWREGATDCAGQ